MKLVIDRAKWLRGEDSQNSKLLRIKDQKRCCIGFLCSALGVSDSELLDVGGSQKLFAELPTWLKDSGEMADNEHSDLFTAYDVNDNPELDEATREARITKIFARHDIQVEFVG